LLVTDVTFTRLDINYNPGIILRCITANAQPEDHSFRGALRDFLDDTNLLQRLREYTTNPNGFLANILETKRGHSEGFYSAASVIFSLLERCTQPIDVGRHFLERCYISAIVFPTPTLARRSFITANTRGLRLNLMEVVRSQIHDVLANDETRFGYMSHFEDCVKILDFDNDIFSDVLRQILLFQDIERITNTDLTASDVRDVCDRMKSSIDLSEFIEWLTDATKTKRFIDEYLVVMVNAASVFRKPGDGRTRPRDQVHLKIFQCWKGFWWKLPILAALFTSPARTTTYFHDAFIFHLNSFLAWLHFCESSSSMWTSLLSVTRWILTNRSSAVPFSQFMEPDWPAQLSTAIQGNVYDPHHSERARYLLMLLEAHENNQHFLALPANSTNTTVEHLLPQTLDPRSDWSSFGWTRETHSQAIHRLGNLFLLEPGRNSAARNFSFARKMEVYFANERTQETRMTWFLSNSALRRLTTQFTPQDYTTFHSQKIQQVLPLLGIPPETITALRVAFETIAITTVPIAATTLNPATTGPTIPAITMTTAATIPATIPATTGPMIPTTTRTVNFPTMVPATTYATIPATISPTTSPMITTRTTTPAVIPVTKDQVAAELSLAIACFTRPVVSQATRYAESTVRDFANLPYRRTFAAAQAFTTFLNQRNYQGVSNRYLV
jgi:hypothetical protein